MALVSKAEVKTHNEIPSSDTSKDALINSLITGVSRFFASKTGRDFESESRTQRKYGHVGDGIIRLKYSPVISIDEVRRNDIAFTATQLANVRFNPDTGTLWLDKHGVANTGFYDADYEIDYTTGFDVVPDDVKMMANELIGAILLSPGASSLKSVRLGDYSFQRFIDDVSGGVGALVQSTIDSYKAIN